MEIYVLGFDTPKFIDTNKKWSSRPKEIGLYIDYDGNLNLDSQSKIIYDCDLKANQYAYVFPTKYGYMVAKREIVQSKVDMLCMLYAESHVVCGVELYDYNKPLKTNVSEMEFDEALRNWATELMFSTMSPSELMEFVERKTQEVYDNGIEVGKWTKMHEIKKALGL